MRNSDNDKWDLPEFKQLGKNSKYLHGYLFDVVNHACFLDLSSKPPNSGNPLKIKSRGERGKRDTFDGVKSLEALNKSGSKLLDIPGLMMSRRLLVLPQPDGLHIYTNHSNDQTQLNHHEQVESTGFPLKSKFKKNKKKQLNLLTVKEIYKHSIVLDVKV